MSRILAYVVLTALLLALTGCREKEIPVTTVETVAETTAAVAEATLPVETEPEEVLLERPISGQVCVGIIPTEVGYWRYVAIEDQEAAKAAYEKAAAAMEEGEPYVKGDRTTGMLVAYGDYWEILESGDMAASLGRVKAPDTAELYEICMTAAEKAGHQEAVKPEQIVDVTKATLRLDSEAIVHGDFLQIQESQELVLTDPGKLQKLEEMLSGAEFFLGTTRCTFGWLLTMETAAGETLTVNIATDSCGTWMSEGMFYDFGSESKPLLELFVPEE